MMGTGAERLPAVAAEHVARTPMLFADVSAARGSDWVPLPCRSVERHASLIGLMRSLLPQRPVWVRLVAALFVCLIVSDLTLDVGCDGPPPTATSGVAIAQASDDHDNDACAPLCVADCYCCSRTVAASLTAALPEVGPSVILPAFCPTAPPDVAQSVPYHPPLQLV